MYDLEIPGFCPTPQLQFIAEIAARVPADGKIVEVGSMFGRSAYCWAASCPASATVYCIDPWPGAELTGYTGPNSLQGKPVRLENTKARFLGFLQERGIKNVVAIQNTSPLAEGWKHGAVDLIYIDGLHDYEGFCADLEFWLGHLKKGGVFCGDDFIADFPDVVRAVQEFALKQGLVVRQYCKMWLLISEDNEAWLKNAYSALLAKQADDKEST